MHRAAASLGFLGNPAGIKRAEAVRLRPSSKQHYCSSHPLRYAVGAASTSLQPWKISVVPLLERVHAVAQTSAGPSSKEYEFCDGIDDVFQS
jgi:nitroreductase